jgi:hypothetical protein
MKDEDVAKPKTGIAARCPYLGRGEGAPGGVWGRQGVRRAVNIGRN